MAEERTARMSSVLGETSVVVGNVHGTGDLEIRGRVQGSVALSGRVLIAETGVVLGNVEATHIDVAGEVRGDLSAKDGVEVQTQGRVEGNIEAPRVGIEGGARVRGMLRTGGELPLPQGKAPGPSERTGRKDGSDRTVDVPSLDSAEKGDELSTPPKHPEPEHRGREQVQQRNESSRHHESQHTREPRPNADSPLRGGERSRKLKPARGQESERRSDEQLRKPELRKPEPRKPEPRKPELRKPELRRPEPKKPDPGKAEAGKAEARKPDPSKSERRKGPPAPPTFIKGSRGRAK